MSYSKLENKSEDEKAILDRGSAKLRESLISLRETEQTGSAIGLELARHDEVLTKIDRSLDETDVQLNVSDRLLRGMSGFFGRVANAFTKLNDKPFQPLVVDKNSTTATTTTTTKSRARDEDTAPRLLMKETRGNAGDDAMLDEILLVLGSVKHQAHALNGAIASQDAKLDVISAKVDRSAARVKRNTTKVVKLS